MFHPSSIDRLRRTSAPQCRPTRHRTFLRRDDHMGTNPGAHAIASVEPEQREGRQMPESMFRGTYVKHFVGADNPKPYPMTLSEAIRCLDPFSAVRTVPARIAGVMAKIASIAQGSR